MITPICAILLPHHHSDLSLYVYIYTLEKQKNRTRIEQRKKQREERGVGKQTWKLIKARSIMWKGSIYNWGE